MVKGYFASILIFKYFLLLFFTAAALCHVSFISHSTFVTTVAKSDKVALYAPPFLS